MEPILKKVFIHSCSFLAAIMKRKAIFFTIMICYKFHFVVLRCNWILYYHRTFINWLSILFFSKSKDTWRNKFWT
jgi:hypothetical protein